LFPEILRIEMNDFRECLVIRSEAVLIMLKGVAAKPFADGTSCKRLQREAQHDSSSSSIDGAACSARERDGLLVHYENSY